MCFDRVEVLSSTNFRGSKTGSPEFLEFNVKVKVSSDFPLFVGNLFLNYLMLQFRGVPPGEVTRVYRNFGDVFVNNSL